MVDVKILYTAKVQQTNTIKCVIKQRYMTFNLASLFLCHLPPELIIRLISYQDGLHLLWSALQKNIWKKDQSGGAGIEDFIILSLTLSP